MYVIEWLDYNFSFGYLTEDSDFKGSILLAKVFATEKEAKQEIKLNSVLAGSCGIIKLTDQQYKTIRRHKLRVKAKELFNLKANSPMWLVADRYEDEGMLEEANLLR